MPELGIMTVKSNDELVKEEDEQARKEVEQRQNAPVITSLASYVRQCWEAAARAKEEHKNAMLSALRQRNGIYEPQKLQEIQESGANSTVFMMLTDEKCNAAESWIEDILLPPDDKPWGVKPSPEPDLNPKIMEALQQQAQMIAQQQVRQKAMQAQAQGQEIAQEDLQSAFQQELQEAMTEMQQWVSEQSQKINDELETELDDDLTEAGWSEALKDVISDIVTYRAGFLKGPIVRYREKLTWGDNGQPMVERRPCLEFERVSPFDIYPAPSAKRIDDGYLIERHELTRGDLQALKGEGTDFDDQAIDAVLREYGQGGLQNWLWRSQDQTLNDLQGREQEPYDPESRIDAIQFWGSVQGLMLLQWGMSPERIDPVQEYYVEIWLIGNYVVKAELNGELLGRKPYYKASFRERNGQFWGYGLPELIQDCQDACNASARNLFNNMSISSGPQVGVDVSSMAEGEDMTQMFPWKIWQFSSSQMANTSQQPLWFFQPQPNIEALMSVYDKFSIEADNKSGIPRYAYGGSAEESSGAADTASGYSMMMQNATKQVRKIIGNIDRGIIRPSVKRHFDFLLVNDPEFAQKYKGDLQIIAKGSSDLAAKEQQQVRRNEFLQLVLQSPVAQQIIEMPGIAALLRETVSGMDIGMEDIVPTKEQVRRKQARMQAQQVMQQQQGQEQSQGGPKQGRQVQPGGAVQGGADTKTME